MVGGGTPNLYKLLQKTKLMPFSVKHKFVGEDNGEGHMIFVEESVPCSTLLAETYGDSYIPLCDSFGDYETCVIECYGFDEECPTGYSCDLEEYKCVADGGPASAPLIAQGFFSKVWDFLIFWN